MRGFHPAMSRPDKISIGQFGFSADLFNTPEIPRPMVSIPTGLANAEAGWSPGNGIKFWNILICR